MRIEKDEGEAGRKETVGGEEREKWKKGLQ